MSIYDRQFNVLLEQDAEAQGAPTMAGLQAPPADGGAPGIPGEPGNDQTISAISDVQNNPVVNYQKEQNVAMTQSIGQWIAQIDEFTDFLNGLDGGSLQSQLNNAPCDTLFNKVSTSETKKISRIAQDLRGLVESLKGYLLSSEEN